MQGDAHAIICCFLNLHCVKRFNQVLYVNDYVGKPSLVSLSNTANRTCRFSQASDTCASPILQPTIHSTSEYL